MSPILISLQANGDYQLTSGRDGVVFDIDGDGVPDEVAWTKAGSQVAFLARDRNGDGQITSGKELFGSFTYPGVKNGFDALLKAARDSNGSHGSISSDDSLFAELPCGQTQPTTE